MSDDAGTTKPSIEEARERYRIEREKRLRPEANAQYHDLTGEFEDFDQDPYSPPIVRDPIEADTHVVIVGGGFGGMLAAANLTKLGITDFRLIEKGGDFGGTWYWNRYPGCMCDVESYVYLPLLEETGYMPTMKYAHAPEIFEYCQLLGRHFDLYRAALFQTEVADMSFDDATGLWTTVTDRGDRLTSKYVVIAGGVLSRAKLPGIPGIEEFEGARFHTSRWDYSQTGGGPYDTMDKLADKVVGVIGTGATAVQVVPAVARSAKELLVFQRTPSAVGVRNQGPTDVEWFKSLEPGWQKERIENFTQAVTGSQPDRNLVGDTWTSMLWVDTRNVPSDDAEAAFYEREDFEQMQAIRDRIASIVEDPETAAKLQPWYSKFCKRPCFHDEYLPAFNRPNVHLVDTDGHGVERITPEGVVVDGVEHPVDVLIFASGFEVTTDYHHRLGFDPKGRGGVSMSESWAEGPHTLHGVLTNGFPNLMMISTVQGAFGTNFAHYLTETSRHVAELIEACDEDGIATIEASTDAEGEWFDLLMTMIGGLAVYNMTCTPGYLNNEQGQGDMKAARNSPYMGSMLDYARLLEAWRREGTLAGAETTTA
jgi:cation diffusion facilitator CzcD-associated flavoprotein CzcO